MSRGDDDGVEQFIIGMVKFLGGVLITLLAILGLAARRRQEKDPGVVSFQVTTVGIAGGIAFIVLSLILVNSSVTGELSGGLLYTGVFFAGFVLLAIGISGSPVRMSATQPPSKPASHTGHTEGTDNTCAGYVGGGLLMGLAFLLTLSGLIDTTLGGIVCTGALSLGFWIVLAASVGRFDQTEDYSPEIETIKEINVYTIRVQPEKWNDEASRRFVEQLIFTFPALVFRIYADHQTILWQLVDLTRNPDKGILERLIRSSYANAEIEIARFKPGDVETPFFRYVCQYHQPNMFVAPIQYVDDLRRFDPIDALAQAMNDLQAGERVIYTLGLLGNASDAYERGERMITQSTIHPLQFLSREGVEDAVAKVVTGQTRVEKYVSQDQHVLQGKLREKLYYATVMIQVDAPDPERLIELLVSMDTQMSHFTRMPYNALQWVDRSLERYTTLVENARQNASQSAIGIYRRRADNLGGDLPPRLILESRELAAIWHLPHEGCSASRIAWASDVVAVSESVARSDQGIVLGLAKYQGGEKPVRLPSTDRVTHVNIVGRTGTGKSTFMHHLIRQDIAAGHGVAVIDPHGKLVGDILQISIPEERIDDVVLLDLANRSYPPPMNPLSGVIGYSGVMGVVGVIERLFEGTEQAARMSSFLRVALLLLQNQPQATMRDVSRIFMDDVFREHLLDVCDNPEVQDFWDYQFSRASKGFQHQVAEPIINRIRPFYGNMALYPVLCHPDALDFRQIIADKKILLISLQVNSDDVPEQEQNLIGTLLVSRLQSSGMQEGANEPFFVYIDEVQRFATTSLDVMFSESRKYGLSLTVANQFLGQLEGKTLDSVMGNVGTSVVFRCSPQDTRTLAAYMKPEYDASGLLNLDRFQAAVKMQVGDKTQPAFTLMTLPPLDVPENSAEHEARIREASIQNYTPRSKNEVMDWLRKRYPRRGSSSDNNSDDKQSDGDKPKGGDDYYE